MASNHRVHLYSIRECSEIRLKMGLFVWDRFYWYLSRVEIEFSSMNDIYSKCARYISDYSDWRLWTEHSEHRCDVMINVLPFWFFRFCSETHAPTRNLRKHNHLWIIVNKTNPTTGRHTHSNDIAINMLSFHHYTNMSTKFRVCYWSTYLSVTTINH